MIETIHGKSVKPEVIPIRETRNSDINEDRIDTIMEVGQHIGDTAITGSRDQARLWGNDKEVVFTLRDQSKHALGYSYLTDEEDGQDLIVAFRGLSFDELEMVARKSLAHLDSWVSAEGLYAYIDACYDASTVDSELKQGLVAA